MLVSQLAMELRYDLKDMQKVNHSDAKLLYVLNKVLRHLNISLVNKGSDIVKSLDTILNLTSTGNETVQGNIVYSASLPTDYMGMVKDYVLYNGTSLLPRTNTKPLDEFTYEIVNGVIYATMTPLVIRYYNSFTDLTALTGSLPVPDYFSELLKKYMLLMINNDASSIDAADLQQLERDVYSLTAFRDKATLILKPTYSFTGVYRP